MTPKDPEEIDRSSEKKSTDRDYTGKVDVENKSRVEKAADKLPDDLLEKAQKLASDIENLKAATGGSITGITTFAASLMLKYIKPGLTEDRRVAGSVAGAALGAKLCGPVCAFLGAAAGGIYGHLKPKNKGRGEDDDAENTDDDSKNKVSGEEDYAENADDD